MSAFCVTCGAKVTSETSYCGACGASLRSSADTSPALSLQTPAVPSEGVMAPATPAAAAAGSNPPPRLAIVAGLLGLLGVVAAIPTVILLVDSIRLFQFGRFGVAFGLAGIIGCINVGAFSAGCVLLGRGLYRADRVARVLTIAGCTAFAAAALLSSSRNIGWVIAAIAAIAVIALLAADPSIRSHFTGPDAPSHGQPTTVLAARVLLLVAAFFTADVAATFVALGIVQASSFVYALIFGAIGVTEWLLARQLGAGDRRARAVVTALALVYLVIALVAGHGAVGVVLACAGTAVIPGLLWLPDSSRAYFGANSWTEGDLSKPIWSKVASAELRLDRVIAAAVTAGRSA